MRCQQLCVVIALLTTTVHIKYTAQGSGGVARCSRGSNTGHWQQNTVDDQQL